VTPSLALPVLDVILFARQVAILSADYSYAFLRFADLDGFGPVAATAGVAVWSDAFAVLLDPFCETNSSNRMPL
jgi:hypothetical protein